MTHFEGRLFAGLLFAGRLFGGPDDEAAEDTDQEFSAFGVHRRRSWRPEPVIVAAPPKRPRRRRQEEVLFLGV